MENSREEDSKVEDSKFRNGVRAASRALEVLLAFSAEDTALSAVELARRTGLNRATLYRLLFTLEKLGFISSFGEPQRFQLGPAVARLAHAWFATLDLNSVADPVLRRLAAETDETVALFVLQGARRLCAVEIPSQQVISYRRGVGYSEDLVKGASGKAILAFADAKTAHDAFASVKDADARARIEQELAQIRSRGYAISQGALIKGAVAISAPFFDRFGHVAGSIGVFGPDIRLDFNRIETFGQAALDAARELTRALGGAAAAGDGQAVPA